MSKRLTVSIVLLLLIGLADRAAAQMFSSRADRPSLSERLRGRQRAQRGTGPAAAETVGTVEGSERFIRGNRSATDFVGADLAEQQTFVGAQGVELTQEVRTAVEDLRPTRERDLNEQMRAPRGSRMYLPRLRVDFSFETPASSEIGRRVVTQLQATETLTTLAPIEVSVADGKATLRGVVASERDREMAELVARFEPGIASVKNEIQVRPSLRPPPPAPARLNASPPRSIP
jgi:hypothetical protein